VISAFLSFAIVVTGIVAFFTGFSEYHRALSPGVEFASPPSLIVVLHWCVVAMASATMGVVAYARYTPNVFYLMWKGVVPGLVTIFACGYVYYLVLFFRSDEFTAVEACHNFDDWRDYRRQVRSSQPFEEYTAYGERGPARCDIVEPLRIHASSSNDSSVFPDIADIGLHRVITDIWVNWTYYSILPLVITEFNVKSCVPDTSSLGRRDWVFRRETKFEGYIRSQFITHDGTLPWTMSRAAAVVAGIMGWGVLYCYRIDAVPISRVIAMKVNAVMHHMEQNCTLVHWDCNC
jgi:hypothetical protein